MVKLSELQKYDKQVYNLFIEQITAIIYSLWIIFVLIIIILPLLSLQWTFWTAITVMCKLFNFPYFWIYVYSLCYLFWLSWLLKTLKTCFKYLKTRQKLKTCESSDINGTSYTCVVCYGNKVQCIIRPCNHVCLCLCCKPLFESNSRDCPMCRTLISSIEQVYLP